MFRCDYFQLKPNHPGFPWYMRPESAEDEEDAMPGGRSIEWEVAKQVVKSGADCGCNAWCCCINPEEVVGILTEQD